MIKIAKELELLIKSDKDFVWRNSEWLRGDFWGISLNAAIKIAKKHDLAVINHRRFIKITKKINKSYQELVEDEYLTIKFEDWYDTGVLINVNRFNYETEIFNSERIKVEAKK